MILGRIGWVEEGILGTQKQFLANATYNANMFFKSRPSKPWTTTAPRCIQTNSHPADRMVVGASCQTTLFMVKPSRKQFLNELRNLPRPQKGVFAHADHAWRENEVPRPLSRGLRLACLSFCFGRLLSEAQLSFCEFAAYQKFPNSDVTETGRRSI